MIAKGIRRTFDFLFSTRIKKWLEKFVFLTAIVLFLAHALVIVLVDLGMIPLGVYTKAGELPSPLEALYTPFSVILLYEIYLLIYYLPKSITIYLGKQYEIVALILIRSIFEDLAGLSKTGITAIDNTSMILWKFGGLIVLLLLILAFYMLSGKKNTRVDEAQCDARRLRFVLVKKALALLLLVVFVVIFVISLVDIKDVDRIAMIDIVSLVKTTSYRFFREFFTVLILTEVLLLLFMYNLSSTFHKVIRNSGFIISTTLLKISFQAETTLNILLIILAVLFGVIILAIDKLFKNKVVETD